MRKVLIVVVVIVIAFFGWTKLRYDSFEPCRAAAVSYREKVEAALAQKLQGTPEAMVLQLLGPAVQPMLDAVLGAGFNTRATYECVAAVPYLETPWGQARADEDADKLIARLRSQGGPTAPTPPASP